MEIRPANPEDISTLTALLEENGLPLDGFPEDCEIVLCVVDGSDRVGCAGIEIHGQFGLLRSVAVSPSRQGQGIGGKLVQAALEAACSRQLAAVYLLTETAVAYFPRFGYRPLERTLVPPEVRQSIEFTTACPDTAVAMELRLPAEPARSRSGKSTAA